MAGLRQRALLYLVRVSASEPCPCLPYASDARPCCCARPAPPRPETSPFASLRTWLHQSPPVYFRGGRGQRPALRVHKRKRSHALGPPLPQVPGRADTPLLVGRAPSAGAISWLG